MCALGKTRVMNKNDDDHEDFTAEDLEKSLASKDLTATALGNRKLRLTISGVKKQLFTNEDGSKETKPVLHFLESSQLLQANKTNRRVLKAELGDNPRAWVGAVIGIYTDPTVMFNGQP